jgi:NAD+ kinase
LWLWCFEFHARTPQATVVNYNDDSPTNVAAENKNMTQSSWQQQGREKPNIVVMLAPDKPRVAEAFNRLEESFHREANVVHIDRDFSYEFRGNEVDLVVVLGGDGSILQAARQMGYNQRPVLGVNLGRLGFLAALQPTQFLELWPSISRGSFLLSNHLMFETEVWDDGKLLECRLGLNETSVLGGPPYAMLRIDLHADGHLATTYSCDGLLISTPIGSTAYNLSAGGPILQNLLQAFVISPICPHALTMRPVVDTADRVFELRLLEDHPMCSVVVDGRVVSAFTTKHRVLIRRAQAQFQMITFPGRDDYASLRDKLGWSGSPKLQG